MKELANIHPTHSSIVGKIAFLQSESTLYEEKTFESFCELIPEVEDIIDKIDKGLK